MTAPAPITAHTAELIREMRKEQAPSIADALKQCRDALAYHQEQTRPISRTADAITAADTALAALSEPQDERAAFETYCKRGNINTAFMMSSAYPAGTYADSRTDAAWHAWQARASLAPAPQPQPVSPADELPGAALAAVREPLSDEQIAFCIYEARMESGTFKRDGTMSFRIARAIERAHGIKESK